MLHDTLCKVFFTSSKDKQTPEAGMSYQERRAIVALFSTILITLVYSAFMLQRYPEADPYSAEIFHFWGSFMLILIPVSIVAKIVIAIAFVIANTVATREIEPDLTDERDRLIELKAQRNSFYIFALGFVLAMGSLVVGQPPATMFIILLAGGLLSDIVSELSMIFFYRRGF
jgi:uncharacterized membrane protein